MVRKLGVGVSIAFILCCSVSLRLLNWIGVFWERIGFLVQCLCAYNSPRMQGLIFLPYSRLSLKQMILGLGERLSRLGEWVSPKREFERVGNSVWHPAQAGIPIFWVKECLALARASRLSENAKNVLLWGWLVAQARVLVLLGETWTRPGECNSPKRELENALVQFWPFNSRYRPRLSLNRSIKWCSGNFVIFFNFYASVH